LAEREGFEPPIPFQVCRFSRPVPSTARPPLRRGRLQFISSDRRRTASQTHIAKLVIVKFAEAISRSWSNGLCCRLDRPICLEFPGDNHAQARSGRCFI